MNPEMRGKVVRLVLRRGKSEEEAQGTADLFERFDQAWPERPPNDWYRSLLAQYKSADAPKPEPCGCGCECCG